ncbi:MAG: DUF3147 family protein [Acidobacteriales bacterium]|nr:DUF3147 family protein [Terriglobales bacterium]
MRIKVDPSAPRKTKWHEYAIRFVFGGAVTVAAGIIAKIYGPVVGGLFLASPAIFPASATLLEKHERERKQRLGLNGAKRAMDAASIDAVGAAIGSLGLLAFAVVCWKFFPRLSVWTVLTLATLAWMFVSVLLWHLRKRDQLLRPK